jgi:hypothetical protein
LASNISLLINKKTKDLAVIINHIKFRDDRVYSSISEVVDDLEIWIVSESDSTMRKTLSYGLKRSEVIRTFVQQGFEPITNAV